MYDLRCRDDLEDTQVPTKGNPRHAFRFEPGLWRAFLVAAARDPQGRSAAVIVRDFVCWYVGQRGTLRPVRPPKSRSAIQNSSPVSPGADSNSI